MDHASQPIGVRVGYRCSDGHSGIGLALLKDEASAEDPEVIARIRCSCGREGFAQLQDCG